MYTIDKARQIFPDTQTADAVPAFFSHHRPSRCWNRLHRCSRLRLGSTIRLTLPSFRLLDAISDKQSESFYVNVVCLLQLSKRRLVGEGNA